MGEASLLPTSGGPKTLPELLLGHADPLLELIARRDLAVRRHLVDRLGQDVRDTLRRLLLGHSSLRGDALHFALAECLLHLLAQHPRVRLLARAGALEAVEQSADAA